ncbi:flagellar hook-length control protein FliK [Cohnella panacarvi]|uniref:flagellar hook-length control protein FliK n=1 Tax=Cohnella panacarvi TaxID=400776 RepID=UPI00047BCB65|nr:flagellar hook-length control protein FliK [Cohnella panacarvi]
MNMSITTAPKATIAAPGASQAGAANGASGNAFAGALFGAMNGSGENAAVGNAIMPVGLVALLGQLGITQSEGQPDELLAILAKLVEQLGQLEQDGQLQSDNNDQLAALLVAFQGILQQIEIAQPSTGTPAQEDSVSLLDSEASPDARTTSQMLFAALKTTLQQVSDALTRNPELLKQSPALFGELQMLVKTLNDQVGTSAGATADQLQTVDDQTKIAVTRDPKLEAAGTTSSKEATNQAMTVSVDNKTAAPALRDPVWKFQVVKPGGENVSADGLAANVAPVLSGEETAGTESQPAWTFLSQDAKAAAEAAQAKAAMPAQVPVQQFAEQMQKFMVKQFMLTQGNGTTEARLTLTPEHLGQVDIRIIMQNGQLTAQFMTDNVMARELLENQMSQLRSSLSAQGLQVDRLEVVQQPSNANTTSLLNQDGRQNGFAGNGNGSNNRGDNGTYEDKVDFEDELARTSTLREAGYGSSLNVTA